MLTPERPSAGAGTTLSMKMALARAGLCKDDVELYEINEAFLPRFAAGVHETAFDRSRPNRRLTRGSNSRALDG